MTKQNTDILASFVGGENRKSFRVLSKKVRECNDLEQLWDYTRYSDYSEKIQELAYECTREKIDGILAGISDVEYLRKLYTERYWLHWCYPGGKILNRLKELYGSIASLDELFDEKKKLRGSIHESNRPIYNIIEDRICSVIEVDARNTSFEFLIEVWGKFAPSLESYKRIEALMPLAISKENDLKKILAWKEKSFRGWDHYSHDCARHISHRVNELIDIALPTTVKFIQFDYFRRIAIGEDMRKKIDNRLSEVALKKLEKCSLKETLSYPEMLKECGNLHSHFPITEKNIHHLIRDKAQSEMPSFQDAKSLYDYMCEFRGGHQICSKRFEELIPDYFENNSDLRTALLWVQSWPVRELWKIIASLLEKEDSPEMVIEILEYYTEKVEEGSIWNIYEEEKIVLAKAQERFKEIVSNLSEPDAWFVDCVREEKFYDLKNLFFKKAKQFAARK